MVDVICTLSNYVTLQSLYFILIICPDLGGGSVVAGKLVCLVVACDDFACFFFFLMLVGK